MTVHRSKSNLFKTLRLKILKTFLDRFPFVVSQQRALRQFEHPIRKRPLKLFCSLRIARPIALVVIQKKIINVQYSFRAQHTPNFGKKGRLRVVGRNASKDRNETHRVESRIREGNR